ncbi:MAG: hypothetical protein QXE01_08815 [Sulfolobales archaeon]
MTNGYGMADTETLLLPRVVAAKLCQEAERMELAVGEYLLEVLSQSGDPRGRDGAEIFLMFRVEANNIFRARLGLEQSPHHPGGSSINL